METGNYHWSAYWEVILNFLNMSCTYSLICTNQLVLKSYLSIMYPGTFQAKSLKIYKLPCNGNSTSLRLSSPYSPSHSCLKLDSSKESFEIYGLAALGTFLTGLFHALYLPHLQGRTQVLQPGSVKFTFKLRIMYATCAGIANQQEGPNLFHERF